MLFFAIFSLKFLNLYVILKRHTCFRDTLAFADVRPEAATKGNRLLGEYCVCRTRRYWTRVRAEAAVILKWTLMRLIIRNWLHILVRILILVRIFANTIRIPVKSPDFWNI
jgi:hypothetical protein